MFTVNTSESKSLPLGTRILVRCQGRLGTFRHLAPIVFSPGIFATCVKISEKVPCGGSFTTVPGKQGEKLEKLLLYRPAILILSDDDLLLTATSSLNIMTPHVTRRLNSNKEEGQKYNVEKDKSKATVRSPFSTSL